MTCDICHDGKELNKCNCDHFYGHSESDLKESLYRILITWKDWQDLERHSEFGSEIMQLYILKRWPQLAHAWWNYKNSKDNLDCCIKNIEMRLI